MKGYLRRRLKSRGLPSYAPQTGRCTVTMQRILFGREPGLQRRLSPPKGATSRKSMFLPLGTNAPVPGSTSYLQPSKLPLHYQAPPPFPGSMPEYHPRRMSLLWRTCVIARCGCLPRLTGELGPWITLRCIGKARSPCTKGEQVFVVLDQYKPLMRLLNASTSRSCTWVLDSS